MLGYHASIHRNQLRTDKNKHIKQDRKYQQERTEENHRMI